MRRRRVAGVTMESRVMVFGKKGLLKVRYVGTRKGTWKGPVTCHPYVVVPEQVLWMDQSDADAMLTWRDEEDRFVFKKLGKR